MEILYEKGFAIDKDVDIVINSANGFLLLGKSGAGQIRKKSKELDFIDKLRYRYLLTELPKRISNLLIDDFYGCAALLIMSDFSRISG